MSCHVVSAPGNIQQWTGLFPHGIGRSFASADRVTLKQ